MTNENKQPKQLNLFENNSTYSFSEIELDQEYFGSFSWAIPGAFKDPLSLCRFEEGDMLHNTTKGYLSPWSEALEHLNFSIQVIFPPRAVRKDSSVESDTILEGNWNGRVDIDLFIYENKKITDKKHISTTQGNLYTFLWKNQINTITADQRSILPLTSKPIKWLLRKSTNHFYHHLLNSNFPQTIDIQAREEQHLEALSLNPDSVKFVIENAIETTENLKKAHNATELFILLHDKSNPILRDKFNLLKSKLETNGKNFKLYFCRPSEILYLKNKELLPTLQFACFLSLESENDLLLKYVKSLFYKPSKNKITDKENFRIESHGLYIASKMV